MKTLNRESEKGRRAKKNQRGKNPIPALLTWGTTREDRELTKNRKTSRKQSKKWKGQERYGDLTLCRAIKKIIKVKSPEFKKI